MILNTFHLRGGRPGVILSTIQGYIIMPPARGRFGSTVPARHQGLRNVGCAPARAVLSFSYPDILFHTVFLFSALL